MKFTNTLAYALLSSITAAAPTNTPTSNDEECTSNVTVGKAVYFLTNEPAENAVVALPIGKDGTLSKGSMIKTGGLGSNSLDAMGQPNVPDPLIGQGALTVVGHNLFAVNAGSNTLSMFRISRSDPTKLHLLGSPIPVSGEFPNTVAASMKHKLVCVGQSGALAGISCSNFREDGLYEMDALREFDFNKTTPPMTNANTISHVFFSGDQSKLFVTIKGDAMTNTTGTFASFDVKGEDGKASLATDGKRTMLPGTTTPFGSAALPGTSNQAMMSDPSFGAALVSVKEDGSAYIEARNDIPDQQATCWATINSNTHSAYTTDPVAARIVELSLKDASTIGMLTLDLAADPRPIDVNNAGNFVYALTPGNGTSASSVTVIDVSGGQGSLRLAQEYSLAGIANGNAQGMAVLV